MQRIKTALTELLGIDHPILLAPMGSAAGGKLAAAVTQAGGLGIIGSGYADREAVARELTSAGNTRVGVGFILWALDQRPEVLDVALAAKPPVIMLSFGDPAPYAGAIKAAGSKLICQVQTLEAARQAVQAGADILIAQGRDAGGHAGTTRGTMGFVPAVVDLAGAIPVVAAGGIADGRGLAAALALGAAGVLMGTRFTAAKESLFDEVLKQGVIDAGGDDTEQTRVFDIVRGAGWPERFPGRAVKNAFLDKWRDREGELQTVWREEEKAYAASAPADLSTRVLWTGEGVDLVHEVLPAIEIVERIVAEAISVLERGARLLAR